MTQTTSAAQPHRTKLGSVDCAHRIRGYKSNACARQCQEEAGFDVWNAEMPHKRLELLRQVLAWLWLIHNLQAVANLM